MNQAVTVAGTGLSVTFTKVVSDNRCRPGTQCIQAGEAIVMVAVTRAGMAPASLTLSTDTPKSARYGRYTVELAGITRGSAPVARLRVT